MRGFGQIEVVKTHDRNVFRTRQPRFADGSQDSKSIMSFPAKIAVGRGMRRRSRRVLE